MPPNPKDFKYPHILLPKIYTHTEPYGSKGFPRKTHIFKRDRPSHRDFLLAQLRAVEEKLTELDKQREAIGISGNEGITVLFKSEPEFELQYESLELRRSGINRKRISSLAIATKDFRDRGKPSSWSSAIDKLTSGYGEENEPKRLMVVCIGNTDVPDRIHYPNSNMSDGIHDPAQAWNALCVGAFTQKVAINTDQNPEYFPIANNGNISPASTTSLNWQRQWPLKPDVVFEGGNWAQSGGSAIGGDLVKSGSLPLIKISHVITLQSPVIPVPQQLK